MKCSSAAEIYRLRWMRCSVSNPFAFGNGAGRVKTLRHGLKERTEDILDYRS